MNALERNAVKRIGTLNMQVMQLHDRICLAGTQVAVNSLMNQVNELTNEIVYTLQYLQEGNTNE